MEQLTLGILPQVAYRAENFLVHKGAVTAFDEALAVLIRERYSAAFLCAPARSGKTHFAIRIASELANRGIFPRLIDGSFFAGFINVEAPAMQFRSDEVFIVDDTDQYFSIIEPGASGPFVNFIERLRGAGAHIFFISSKAPTDFPCDAHVMSRLKEAAYVVLDEPEEEAVPELLARMARQRGIQLSDRKVDFVERRMRRSIKSIEEYLEKVVHLTSVLGKKVSFSLLGDAL